MNLTPEEKLKLSEILQGKEIKPISRPSMDETFLKVAKALAERSACLRRGYGAVAVDPKTNTMITSGYNGGYRKGVNCCDIGYCARVELNIPHGTRYESCRSTIHAEMNVCQHAKSSDLKDSVLYLYGIDKQTGLPVEDVCPCELCGNMLRNAFVSEIRFYKDGEIRSKHLDTLLCGRDGT